MASLFVVTAVLNKIASAVGTHPNRVAETRQAFYAVLAPFDDTHVAEACQRWVEVEETYPTPASFRRLVKVVAGVAPAAAPKPTPPADPARPLIGRRVRFEHGGKSYVGTVVDHGILHDGGSSAFCVLVLLDDGKLDERRADGPTGVTVLPVDTEPVP